MSWEEVVFHIVVFCVGVPSMWRNPTAIALVAAWALGQAAWWLTGENLPLRLYVITDLMVVAVIFCKPDAMDCWPYDGLRSQLVALLKERCAGDRVVVTIFPLMWLTYALQMDDYYRYWILWWLAIVQFLAAGWEAFSITLRRRRKASATETPPGAFRLGLAGNV